jgi:uncharacterized membrane protein YoaT (DUF817 family)
LDSYQRWNRATPVFARRRKNIRITINLKTHHYLDNYKYLLADEKMNAFFRTTITFKIEIGP